MSGSGRAALCRCRDAGLDVRRRDRTDSATAYCRAVAGISCIRPIAPFGDRARGLVGRLDLDDRPDQLGVDAVLRADARSMIGSTRRQSTSGNLSSGRTGGTSRPTLARLGIRHLVGLDPRDDRPARR